MCCSKSIKLNGFIESFLIVNESKDLLQYDEEHDVSVENNITVQENEAPKEVIFQTNSETGGNILKTYPKNGSSMPLEKPIETGNCK